MPELPEVETVKRQLAPRLEGESIVRAKVLDARWCAPAEPGQFERRLEGSKITALGRRGKYFVVELDGGSQFLVMHLRMTGNLLYVDANEGSPNGRAHLRAALKLGNGDWLQFVDPRRFGHASIFDDGSALERYFGERLGPEPLSDQFTPAILARAVAGRAQPVKGLLLNQARVAGIGNIYADEALFRARIHPLQPAGTLTTAEIEALRASVVAALEDGIDAKGASIDDFRDIDGARGAMQDRFLVHRRAGETCPNCGEPIRRIVVAGRGTYLCPDCQRLKRRKLRKRGKRARSPSARASTV